MANPLFNMLGGGNAPNMPGSLGNIANFFNQLNNFRSTYQGNAQQEVQQMLNSGRITQYQFNQVAQMATQIQNM